MPIICKQSLATKLILPGIVAIVAILNVLGVLNNPPVIWVILILVMPLTLVTSPDFTVQEDGLVVHFPWGNQFNPWETVRVIKTPVNVRIFAPNLSMFNWLIGFGRSSFVVTRLGRSNYDEAVQAICERLPKEKIRKTRY